MSASHFIIWTILLFLLAVNAVIGWKLHQLHSGQNQQSGESEQIIVRLTAVERWAAAYAPFMDGRTDDLNKRLIQLETENKEIVTRKRDDESEDPFSGSRAWVTQATAASRAAGVEYIG